jgi:hypothetical protein
VPAAVTSAGAEADTDSDALPSLRAVLFSLVSSLLRRALLADSAEFAEGPTAAAFESGPPSPSRSPVTVAWRAALGAVSTAFAAQAHVRARQLQSLARRVLTGQHTTLSRDYDAWCAKQQQPLPRHAAAALARHRAPQRLPFRPAGDLYAAAATTALSAAGGPGTAATLDDLPARLCDAYARHWRGVLAPWRWHDAWQQKCLHAAVFGSPLALTRPPACAPTLESLRTLVSALERARVGVDDMLLTRYSALLRAHADATAAEQSVELSGSGGPFCFRSHVPLDAIEMAEWGLSLSTRTSAQPAGAENGDDHDADSAGPLGADLLGAAGTGARPTASGLQPSVSFLHPLPPAAAGSGPGAGTGTRVASLSDAIAAAAAEAAAAATCADPDADDHTHAGAGAGVVALEESRTSSPAVLSLSLRCTSLPPLSVATPAQSRPPSAAASPHLRVRARVQADVYGGGAVVFAGAGAGSVLSSPGFASASAAAAAAAAAPLPPALASAARAMLCSPGRATAGWPARALSVRVTEALGHVGLSLWGGALLLAEWAHSGPGARALAGKGVLELGAGVGLTAAVVATLGTREGTVEGTAEGARGHHHDGDDSANVSSEAVAGPAHVVATDCDAPVLVLLARNLTACGVPATLAAWVGGRDEHGGDQGDGGQDKHGDPERDFHDLASSAGARAPAPVTVEQLDWREFEPAQLQAWRADVVLSADCLYAPELVEPHVDVVRAALEAAPVPAEAQCLLTFPVRNPETHARIIAAVAASGLRVETIVWGTVPHTLAPYYQRDQMCFMRLTLQ